MEVLVRKIVDFDIMKEAMEFTSGKNVKLNDKKIKAMYDAEHSPIYTQIFVIHMIDIPTYASVHFARHNNGVTHFVKSNRQSIEPVDRNTPVNHMMFLNAQSVKNILRKRLCGKADIKVQDISKMIKGAMFNVDPILASLLVPTCIFRGNKCHEPTSCGVCQHE